MSAEFVNWWTPIVTNSVQLAIEYMPHVSYAVRASSLNARALGEAQRPAKQRTSNWKELKGNSLADSPIASNSNNEVPKAEEIELDHNIPYHTHAVRFIKNNCYPEYALCMVDVHDLKQVVRML